ncbi:hypothetical protein [Desulfovibrio sp. Fe33]|uniref:hypothetical protein n=1 Tax=Desulfovibrio sp. Fe33 TaxID=3020842 RepID=UPI00234CD93F|nr:hypothetical protein [Desulfovibrio sp. Fe33]
MNRLILAVCIAMAATLCLAAASEAHKVNIFAYVDGDRIVTDSGYSRSNRVHQGEVEVYDAGTGDKLLSGRTDDQGVFAFVIPEAAREKEMDLRLLLKAGQGHQAEWTVKYEEFADAPRPASDMVAEEAPAAAPAVPAVSAAPASPVVSMEAAAGGLTAAQVESIVKREVEPLKRMVAELHDTGPSMTEIIGGIGWIFGLFGVAAYMKSRRRP